MSGDDLRDGITEYIGRYYKRNRRAPSLRNITARFHISNATFYHLFQGIADACRRAQVPVPENRIHQVSRARRTPRRATSIDIDPKIRDELDDLRRLLGAQSVEESVRIAKKICESMMPYVKYHRVRDPDQVMNAIEKHHQAATSRLKTEITQKDTLLETVKRGKDAVQGALVEFTSRFGDDFFTSDSYRKLIAAFKYAQEHGGYSGSFTDMLVQCVELFSQSRGLQFNDRRP